MADSISLPKICEVMENGLRCLDNAVADYDRQIKALQDRREKALVEYTLQRAAVNALAALDDELAKADATLTLRFP